jgi:hypothetical protein
MTTAETRAGLSWAICTTAPEGIVELFVDNSRLLVDGWGCSEWRRVEHAHVSLSGASQGEEG